MKPAEEIRKKEPRDQEGGNRGANILEVFKDFLFVSAFGLPQPSADG